MLKRTTVLNRPVTGYGHLGKRGKRFFGCIHKNRVVYEKTFDDLDAAERWLTEVGEGRLVPPAPKRKKKIRYRKGHQHNFSCDICGRTYNYMGNLRRHIAEEHGKRKPKEKKFSPHKRQKTRKTLSWEAFFKYLVEYKKKQEKMYPGKKWNGHVPRYYYVDLEDRKIAHLGNWVLEQKRNRLQRLKNNVKEESWEEKRLVEIGFKFRHPASITQEEHLGLMIEYIKEQERKHPGKKWDGRLHHTYCAKLEDGTVCKVGKWLANLRTKRNQRLKHNIPLTPLQNRISELGYKWEIEKFDVEPYIELILRYKLEWEKNHLGQIWDGSVPKQYVAHLSDGTEVPIGKWVAQQRASRRRRLRLCKTNFTPIQRRLNSVGINWTYNQMKTKPIRIPEYHYKAALLTHKKYEERKHPGKPWDGNAPEYATLEDGTEAPVKRWAHTQRVQRKRRIKSNIAEEPPIEKWLNEIGFNWGKWIAGAQEYMALLLEYKKNQEMRHPGAPWNGKVPANYSKIIDGVKVSLGSWVETQRAKQRARIRKNVTEETTLEKQLSEIGFDWYPKKSRHEEFMRCLLEYKKNEEMKHPGKPWDGLIPLNYFATLADGRNIYVGKWLRRKRSKRENRIRNNLTNVPPEELRIEKELNDAGISWEQSYARKKHYALKKGVKRKKRNEETSEEESSGDEEEEESSEDEEEESSEDEEEGSSEDEEEESSEKESQSERESDDVDGGSPWEVRTIESFTIASRKLELEDYTEL